VRVLIAYGSKRGGTSGLATMIGDALAALGATVNVRPASGVDDLGSYDAVVVAGALYGHRWHKDARRFARRHTAELRRRPVWMVSSGPLDDSARDGTLPPERQVAELASLVGARGTLTFGGWLSPQARGFPAGLVPRGQPGDWRSREQVEEFARAVRAELSALRQQV
jgi:menaquinone-dependent protoporphyrinogen oxidase